MPIDIPGLASINDCATQIAEYLDLWGKEHGAITKIVATAMGEMWRLRLQSLARMREIRSVVAFASAGVLVVISIACC